MGGLWVICLRVKGKNDTSIKNQSISPIHINLREIDGMINIQ